MSLLLSRRLFWLSVVGLLMQVLLPLSWIACYSMAIYQLCLNDSKLYETYLALQQKTLSSSSLSPTAADMDRLIEAMVPILNQLNWLAVGLLASLCGFSVLGYLYGRLSGHSDYAGALPVLAILSSQNPVTLAMTLADRGVTRAEQGWPAQILMLLVQLLAVYASARWGEQVWARSRPVPSDKSNSRGGSPP